MDTSDRVAFDIHGLDSVLNGGLLPKRSYMVRGGAGTGKTIFGLHFLTAGTALGESCLYINFEEPTEKIVQNAETMGFDLSDVDFLDLSPDAERFAENRTYDIFTADEVELAPVTDAIVAAVDDIQPARVFVDPLTQLRYFSRNTHQFRREVASFVTYLTGTGATVLFSTQPTSGGESDDLQFLGDGTIDLSIEEKGRTVEVTKFRGSSFQTGKHTFRITQQGFEVYPELVPRVHRRMFDAETVPSGVDGLDDLLHGGIERGTVSVISGPSGVGKTTTGSMFMKAAAARGERSVIYMFEESTDTFLHRSESIDVPVERMIDAGTLHIEEVEPLAISSDEFAHKVRQEVEQADTRIVMIDGIAGYRLSLRGDDEDLVRELHAVCRYLRNMGVTVILVDDVPTVTGPFRATSERISYLGDTILFLRYIERHGELRKTIGVLKKRASDFERTIRRFDITNDGLLIGEPLQHMDGVLSGFPEPTEDDSHDD